MDYSFELITNEAISEEQTSALYEDERGGPKDDTLVSCQQGQWSVACLRRGDTLESAIRIAIGQLSEFGLTVRRVILDDLTVLKEE